MNSTPGAWIAACRRELASWGYLALFGATALVIGLSPSTHDRAHRVAMARHIYTSTWRVLPWFAVASALVSLVLIRIVVVTALSYGLSQYALEMMVRVLVLELIPLTAALFVALRAGLAFNAGAALPAAEAERPQRPARSTADFTGEVVPEVIASAFSVLSLAMVSSVIVLVLAYLNVYGLSPWGLVDYTRTVGRIFDPVVTIGFALKTILFGMAVAVIPMAAMFELSRQEGGALSAASSTVQPGAMRLFFVLLLIEAASLAVKYI
jgi:phospholipid/cholesterol/gamma-HCH transport system permease protein